MERMPNDASSDSGTYEPIEYTEQKNQLSPDEYGAMELSDAQRETILFIDRLRGERTRITAHILAIDSNLLMLRAELQATKTLLERPHAYENVEQLNIDVAFYLHSIKEHNIEKDGLYGDFDSITVIIDESRSTLY